MGDPNVQALWRLARRQHGVLSRRQLLDAGISAKAIKHRVTKGRLHRLHVGVYAVGWPEPTRHGRWMAAVLACGSGSALSHASAAALLGIADWEKVVTISVPPTIRPRRCAFRVHRVQLAAADLTVHDRVPVTSPARTLIDLATEFSPKRLERAVSQADKLGLIDPEALRAELAQRPGTRGVPALRRLLDRDTFVLTESELERRFLPIARRAGLGLPETGVSVNGFAVDFFWRDLGLVVETDGLAY
nr:type IV toxin-antitoxin system AbiEi family antitoxin domain-containing protein [Solirubrobacterales bacterium]